LKKLRGRRVFEPADRLALGDEREIAGALSSPELGTQCTSGAFKASVYAHRDILKIN
jgi:hypothetical protein